MFYYAPIDWRDGEKNEKRDLIKLFVTSSRFYPDTDLINKRARVDK